MMISPNLKNKKKNNFKNLLLNKTSQSIKTLQIKVFISTYKYKVLFILIYKFIMIAYIDLTYGKVLYFCDFYIFPK